MFDYLFARHRKEYIRLAFRYWTTPKRVYKLAHGKMARTPKDTAIVHELLELGIVHRHRQSRDAKDYDMGD